MKSVVVVAHPDDETMWSAGYMIRQKGDWTIICCSIPKSDVIRAWKFFDACKVLGASPRLMPLQEEAANIPLRHLEALDLSQYDRIVTHNKEGEYGHQHHKQIHEYVTQNYPDKEIWTFNPKGTGQYVIDLDNRESAQKMEALKCYNHHWPYEGETPPKWEALIHRYGIVEGYDLARESYDIYTS